MMRADHANFSLNMHVRPVDIAAMNSPAKNALRLKMAGLIFTFAGLVAFVAIGDRWRILKSLWLLRHATMYSSRALG